MNITGLIKSVSGANTLDNLFYHPTYFAFLSVLFAFLIYAAFKIIERNKIKVETKFLAALTPYILSCAAIEPLYPIEYSIVFSILLFSSIVFIKIIAEKKELNLDYPILLTGLIILGGVIGVYDPGNLQIIKLTFLTAIIWILPLYLIYLKKNIPLTLLFPIAGHLLDASTTFSATSLGSSEKHWFASKFIETLGPFGIFVFKAVTIIPISVYLYRNLEGDERTYFLYVIGVIGVALAFRNILISL